MNQDVADFIEKIKVEWQADVCQRLREVVHEAVPDIQERIQYGKPHFLKNGKYAAVLSTAKAWVTFTIFNATNIEAPDGFLKIRTLPSARPSKCVKAKCPIMTCLANC